MGVRGLQFYLEQCCDSASPTVSIPKLAANYRASPNNDNELVIVVDGLCCIRILYGDLEWVGGGQLKEFAERAQRFVKAFSEIGIRLVFFFDGPTIVEKRKTWVERGMVTLERVYKVLDALNQGKQSRYISQENFRLPPAVGQLSRLIFQFFCGCEVFQAVNDCDQEIVEYARNHDVFAILAQDTDYVIFDTGRTVYLSMKHLDLYTMTTRMYNSQELTTYLRIHPSQLPLLATLMGNDIVTSDDLKSFHRKIVRYQRVEFRVLVPYLARYIQRLPCNRNQLCNMLQEVSVQMFGTPDKAGNILTSLNSYNIHDGKDCGREDSNGNTSWSKLVDIAKRRHQHSEIPTMIYGIMSGLPFECNTSLEDFRINDLPIFATALQPLRQRLYGVLLQEKPLPDHGRHEVPEYCMAGPGSLDRPNYIPAIPPERPHPGLCELWSDKSGPALSDTRWQLFVSSVSSTLDPHRVRLLPPYLVIPTLILYRFNELNSFAPWEIDAMLATATSLYLYDTARLAALPADPLSSRSIRVASLIMRSTFILNTLLAACGYPLNVHQTASWIFFDGKLFQVKYREAGQGQSHSHLCEHRVDVLKDFQMARCILFSNS